MITTAHEFHNHPEFLDRVYKKTLETPFQLYALNCGRPTKKRERINKIVEKIYDQFCVDMENGKVK